MHRPMRILCLISFAALSCLGSLAQADSPRFEMTPFVGYRMGGSFDYYDADADKDRSVDLDDDMSWGFDLGLYRDTTSFYELLYSNQQSKLQSSGSGLGPVDVRTQYVQLGGTVLYPQDSWFVPFLSGTLGATLLDPSGRYDSETKFSISLGTGIRFPVSDNFAATLGLRGYLTFVGSDTEFLCVSGGGEGGCLVKSSGSTYFQGEATLGFTFMF
jgi:opacity protein-like surface antigen